MTVSTSSRACGSPSCTPFLLFVHFDVTRRSQFALIAIARAVSPDLQQALMHAMSNAATNPAAWRLYNSAAAGPRSRCNKPSAFAQTPVPQLKQRRQQVFDY